MLALDVKATLQGWREPLLVKLAGLGEFVSGAHPVERMVLDLRQSNTADAALMALPWAGFLANQIDEVPSGRPGAVLQGPQQIAKPGDVLEVLPAMSKVAVRYRRGDNGNVLFATERCNSFCLMCSQPPRAIDDDWRVQQLCDLVELIDGDEPSLAISGGEPTLLGDGLAHVVRHCAKFLPHTHIHVLSNGRRFGEGALAETFRDLHPSLSWGIPLYGDSYRLHDYVVQSSGAFAQTLRGLYALQAAGQCVEIRVVLVRPTVERLTEIARFIYRNLPFVEHVALMGVEPIGFAKANREALWVDPVDMARPLLDSAACLSQRGMAVSLYNLPLCTLPRELWRYARRSISNWKQDYLPACEACSVRTECGGFFSWIKPEWTSRAIGPVMQEAEHA